MGWGATDSQLPPDNNGKLIVVNFNRSSRNVNSCLFVHLSICLSRPNLSEALNLHFFSSKITQRAFRNCKLAMAHYFYLRTEMNVFEFVV